MNRRVKTDTHAAAPEGCGEFGVYTDMKDFPVKEYPSYMQEGIGAVCTDGSATIQVSETASRISPGVIPVPGSSSPSPRSAPTSA